MELRSMSSKQKSRALLGKLAKPAVAVCAAVLALLAGEVFIRAFRLAPEIKPIQLSSYDCFYKRSENPVLGFELKANCSSDNPDFIQTYERTNSHGQRDRERKLEKPEGVTRVIILGDSVVEGYGLRESETIPRRLEELYPDGSTEVLNFGVSAYCTLAEIELLEVKGIQFDPDVVILVFVENDFDNFNREAFPLGQTVDRPQVVKTLFRKSHLFRLTCIRLNLFNFEAEADPLQWNKDAVGDNNVAEGLRRFRQLADRHGIQPLVAVWPRFLDDRIADVCFMPQSDKRLVVEHLAAMNGIPSVRLSKFFRRRRREAAGSINPRLHYSCGDELHPSPEGCRIAARALKTVLEDLNTGQTPGAPEIPRSAQLDARALAAAEALGKAPPNYARVHNRMGTELLKQGKLAEAETQFKKALRADPTYAGAYNNLGITCERLGREREAHTQFEQAVRFRPDFTHALFNLARSLMNKGDISQAVTHLQQTIRIDPNHIGALNMLGTALGRQQKFAEARVHLERAVRIDPGNAQAHNNLGAVYAAQGHLRQALSQFETALRLDPGDPEIIENINRVKAALPEQK
jgi:Flp pilus assembly protein TadD/lysophospholipase L1-like esterase